MDFAGKYYQNVCKHFGGDAVGFGLLSQSCDEGLYLCVHILFFDAKVGEQRGSRKDNVRARVRTFLLYLIRPGEGVGDDALKFLPDVLTKEIA